MIFDGPPDELLEKVARENPDWDEDDWAHWWGKWINRQCRKKGIPILHPEDEQ